MRLLEMSISAGALILILTILRRNAWWNLAKQTVMLLWLVVLSRLLLPGSLPIRKGIADPIFFILRRAGICQTKSSLSDAAGKAAAAGLPKAASFGRSVYLADWRQAAVFIWLILAAVAGIYFIRTFYREYRLLAEALPLESALDSISMQAQILEAEDAARRLAGILMQRHRIPILVHDRIRSPLVYGVIRQRIIIPKSFCFLEHTQMQQILLHEIIHIRRFDNLWKLLSAVALCMHWFNPAVWLMYVLFARDMELSCDERVLSAYGSQGRQEYAMTLLALAQNQTGTTLFCSGFLENPVKERIVAIMKYKKLTGIGFLCAVMLFAGATSVFATNEQNKTTEQATEAEKEDLVSYSIVKTENGKQEVEKSGTAKVTDIENENIRLKIQDDKKTEVENVYVEFSPGVHLEEGESGIYSLCETKDGSRYQLEEGKAYDFNVSTESYIVTESGDDGKIKVTDRNGETEISVSKDVQLQEKNADDSPCQILFSTETGEEAIAESSASAAK